MAKRGQTEGGQVEAAIIIENPCSETALRRVCGDDWEICWWLASCALPEEEPLPEG